MCSTHFLCFLYVLIAVFLTVTFNLNININVAEIILIKNMTLLIFNVDVDSI